MIHLQRTNSDNLDFRNLVNALDKELEIHNGAVHSFFAQFNKIDAIKYVVIAYDNEMAVGCGAIKEYSSDTMEVKRMFVPRQLRNQGIATLVLLELEKWCRELNGKKCILETGVFLPEAIRLYQKNNYKIIPNYGQYAGIERSICFEKEI